MKLKYPCKVAGKLYPAGTHIQTLNPEDECVVQQFPNIKINPDSYQVAVKFPDRLLPTIVHISQLEED